MPDYIALFSQRVALKTKTEAEIAVTNAVLDELAALTSGPHHPTMGGPSRAAFDIYAEQGKYSSLYLERGKLETYPHDPPDFHLEVRSLPLEVTRRLCEVLKGAQVGK